MSAPSRSDLIGPALGAPARTRRLPEAFWGLVLLAPGLLLLVALFVVPLLAALWSAFSDKAGAFTTANFATSVSLYGRDILFTAGIVVLSVVLTAVISVLLAGFLTLTRRGPVTRILGWLYRLPLFVPFVCIGQMMRSFLAKNGMMNNGLEAIGLLDPLAAGSLLDWRGIVISFVWKQVPFVTLMVAGAMAALDPALVEAARNMGAGRVRVLLGIVLPLVTAPLTVGCVLTFVTLMSVLSVPMMLSSESPTLITVDMAYRITTFGDYGVANALGVISYLLTAVAGWLYLRHATGDAR
jgi:putative spermidine/putrescine transport system permease protein